MERPVGPKGKKIKKITGITAAVIAFLILCGYLLAHSYISKMNRVEALSNDGVIKETSGGDITDEDSRLDTDSSEDILGEDASGEDASGDDASPEQISSAEEAIRKNMEDKSTSVLSDKNVFNILLIGTDNRKVGENSRSDAMILLSINKKSKTITSASLLRDIYLQIPGKNNNRLNAAYAYGGPSLLMNTI